MSLASAASGVQKQSSVCIEMMRMPRPFRPGHSFACLARRNLLVSDKPALNGPRRGSDDQQRGAGLEQFSKLEMIQWTKIQEDLSLQADEFLCP